jgi:heme-degrading monooxygenase HmoA
MYLRLVHANVKHGLLEFLEKTYDREIIPALEKIPGCLYAFLIKSELKDDEVISMTFWDSIENVKAYEESGRFIKLYNKTKPYLKDSSEWKIQLSEDMELEYKPVEPEPDVKAYKSLAEKGEELQIQENLLHLYLRMMHFKVKKNKMDEFIDLYKTQILPALHSTGGCQYAYLSKGKENEAISLTIWKSKKHADEYEKGGLFQQLLKKAEPLFSELYHWKMSLDKFSGKQMVTSDDIGIVTYTLVTGKKLK